MIKRAGDVLSSTPRIPRSEPSVRSSTSYGLAHAWGEIAKGHVRLAQSLQIKAAEQGKLAERLEQQGRLSEATEARSWEAKWLEEADELLQDAEAAWKLEGQLENHEDSTMAAAQAVVQKQMPTLLVACWSLARSVEASPELDRVVRERLLNQYEALISDLASLRAKQAHLLLERVRSFVQDTRTLPSQKVADVWDHFDETLTAFL